MTSLYLYLNAFLYLILAIWSITKPAVSNNGSGHLLLHTNNKIYAVVELTFTIFLSIAAYFPTLRYTGLVLSVCVYAGIMLVRVLSILIDLIHGEHTKTTYIAGGLEYALGIWGISLLAMENG